MQQLFNNRNKNSINMSNMAYMEPLLQEEQGNLAGGESPHDQSLGELLESPFNNDNKKLLRSQSLGILTRKLRRQNSLTIQEEKEKPSRSFSLSMLSRKFSRQSSLPNLDESQTQNLIEIDEPEQPQISSPTITKAKKNNRTSSAQWFDETIIKKQRLQKAVWEDYEKVKYEEIYHGSPSRSDGVAGLHIYRKQSRTYKWEI
eukprot:TRINITY_DN1573_c0_g1_i1.p1 TRINITY_DN1573_c0_g1~~TRINITY_DN1573_c0_g1_i1.p1  ORF type:complete len:202 (+),score=16.12 TRINITY_DN1573_c0_g1_i1:104-709(+)